MERPNPPVEPQIGEDQYIDTHGNVRTDDLTENERKTLENLEPGESPFDL
jgi:hypothetical protein